MKPAHLPAKHKDGSTKKVYRKAQKVFEGVGSVYAMNSRKGQACQHHYANTCTKIAPIYAGKKLKKKRQGQISLFITSLRANIETAKNMRKGTCHCTKSGRQEKGPYEVFYLHRVTVLVMLATTGSSPSQRRVGKVIRVPPPATAFIAPARKAEPKDIKKASTKLSFQIPQI